MKKSMVAVTLTWVLAFMAMLACGGSGAGAAGNLEGVYSNPEGTASIEFMPEGKAHFSLSGMGGEVTYTVSGDKVAVKMEDEELVLTRREDGALTGPEGYFSRLTKKQ